MDEESLRAMMPMSFGKKPVKKVNKLASTSTVPAAASTSSSTQHSTGLGASVLGKRAAQDTQRDEEDEDEDDGLTAEERAANREAERRATERKAQGLASDSEDDDDDDDDSDSESDVGPPLPPQSSPRKDIVLPPMTNSVKFTGTHTKTISSLAVDPSASRFALGSYDYNLSLYDFGGMSSTHLSPFRKFEPCENYPILDLSFSCNGANLLVVSGTSEAKIFSRDGAELGTCRKGDPYLRDMRNTKGHVSSLTCGMFDPVDPNKFYTAGSDSTVRLWDINTFHQQQTDLIVVKSRMKGKNRTKVTALALNAFDPTMVFASGLDGSLSYWDLRSNLNNKPRGTIDDAHQADTFTSGIAVNKDGRKLVTRGGDGTVKLWDTRQFKAPLAVKHGLRNDSNHTSIIWDPIKGDSVLTCVSASNSNGNRSSDNHNRDVKHQPTDSRGGGGGKIVVLDGLSSSLSTVEEYPADVSPIKLHWSSNTDQLFCTHKDGSLSLYYTPHRSTKGITMVLSKANSKTSSASFYTSANTTGGDQIDSYPIFQGDGGDAPTHNITSGNGMSESAKRRKLEKLRKDPLKSNLPQLPISGPGKGGRIGTAANQHIVQNLLNNHNNSSNSNVNYTAQSLMEDPREALLKYATKPNEGQEQVKFTKAWKTTQPKLQYSKYTDDDNNAA